MNHPDFRASGKIFATLGYPSGEWGMVKLTSKQQSDVLKKRPKAFVPAKGAWGRKGATNVKLHAVTKAALLEVLEMAWTNVVTRQSKL